MPMRPLTTKPSRRSLTLAAIVLSAGVLAGCDTIGNVFSGGGQERPFDTDTAPNVKELLKTKPNGLLPDTENARHTGPSPEFP